MNLNTSNEQNIIERDVHCPYCQSDKALLISGIGEKRSVLQLPDYGKKYWLCVIFTFGLYMLVHGFPMIEKKRVFEFNTYGFCPHCGKTYNASTPAAAKAAKVKSPKVYRSLRDKKLFGICGGIAEYTGLSVTLVRIAMVIYILFGCLSAISYLILRLKNEMIIMPIYSLLGILPAIAYPLLGLTNIMPENPKHQEKN